jgi:hypothetical protein
MAKRFVTLVPEVAVDEDDEGDQQIETKNDAANQDGH